ncbi:MAG: peptidoglycan DD-metalloendopeptidase family protein [Candidatus Parcubacteria bacterium]|nr:peptidoglycan DD-metalloendopeptidase family protein [Candidatus Parcubacteria bacterium]
MFKRLLFIIFVIISFLPIFVFAEVINCNKTNATKVSEWINYSPDTQSRDAACGSPVQQYLWILPLPSLGPLLPAPCDCGIQMIQCKIEQNNDTDIPGESAGSHMRGVFWCNPPICDRGSFGGAGWPCLEYATNPPCVCADGTPVECTAGTINPEAPDPDGVWSCPPESYIGSLFDPKTPYVWETGIPGIIRKGEVMDTKMQGLTGLLNKIIKLVYTFAGILVFVMIVWGGIIYLTSRGNSSSIKDAQDRIGQALLGLFLLFASYLILNTINPELVRISDPTFPNITFSKGTIPIPPGPPIVGPPVSPPTVGDQQTIKDCIKEKESNPWCYFDDGPQCDGYVRDIYACSIAKGANLKALDGTATTIWNNCPAVPMGGQQVGDLAFWCYEENINGNACIDPATRPASENRKSNHIGIYDGTGISQCGDFIGDNSSCPPDDSTCPKTIQPNDLGSSFVFQGYCRPDTGVAPPTVIGESKWPTNEVALSYDSVYSCYGDRPLYGCHMGVDLRLTGTDSVMAVAAGEIIEEDFNSSCGNYIMIAHPNETLVQYYSFYCHLDSYTKNVHDVVIAGEEIAIGGTTGESTGDHLHLGFSSGRDFWKPETKLNPACFLPQIESMCPYSSDRECGGLSFNCP